MSMDLRRALHDITTEAARTVREVEVSRVRTRTRRRRTQGVVLRSVGGLTAVGAVVATVSLLGGGSDPVPTGPVAPLDTASASPSATPSPATPSPTPEPTTPVPGWVAGVEPCGAAFAGESVDDAGLEVQGGVTIGTVDLVTARFIPGPAGDAVWMDVTTTSDVPGRPVGNGVSDLTTTLVDADGIVAFWDDPLRVRPQVKATDGSNSSTLSWLYDAVDCRTGRPLTGTYRVFASDARGPELVELAPLTFGPDGTRPPEPFRDSLPACGEPVPDALLAGAGAADFSVALDPGVDLEDVDVAGLHAPVTVTATGASRLTGRVPQSLRAVLVDDQGIVVAPGSVAGFARYDSGATFDTGAGESFSAEVFEWFSTCLYSGSSGYVAPGTYDLYVDDRVMAVDGSGIPSPRTIVGGPFRITLREAR